MSKQKKILMLGWEFPPLFSGGLGVVTKNLAQALVKQGCDITLVLPQFITQQIIEHQQDPGVPLLTFRDQYHYESSVKILGVETLIYTPYMNAQQYKEIFKNHKNTTKKTRKELPSGTLYGENLWEEIQRFAAEVVALTADRHFDLVHAHDWITAETAIQLKIQRGIPYVIHIHATEVDRTGKTETESEVFKREKYAMEFADKVVTVSQYTKRILVETYGIDPEKIEVVYNAYEAKSKQTEAEKNKYWPKDKSQFWVLFIGRVTLQKGPDYFIEAAKKVIPHAKNVHFFIAGDGDMLPTIKDKIVEYGIQDNVHCVGFLPPEKRDALYMFADACVVPSVSEPFGLTAIEVIDNCTPLIISKNCGANEIIGHKLEVDFWDTERMAEYILALRNYPELRRTLREKAMQNRARLTWDAQAARVREIYENL